MKILSNITFKDKSFKNWASINHIHCLLTNYASILSDLSRFWQSIWLPWSWKIITLCTVQGLRIISNTSQQTQNSHVYTINIFEWIFSQAKNDSCSYSHRILSAFIFAHFYIQLLFNAIFSDWHIQNVKFRAFKDYCYVYMRKIY